MHLLVILADWVTRLLLLLLVVNGLMSWIEPRPRQGWHKIVNGIVEPLLHPIRAIIPPAGNVDFSPMVAALLLYLLRSLLLGSLAH